MGCPGEYKLPGLFRMFTVTGVRPQRGGPDDMTGWFCDEGTRSQVTLLATAVNPWDCHLSSPKTRHFLDRVAHVGLPKHGPNEQVPPS